jgi:ATP-dependent protease ClpP protease subunit
MPALTRYTFLLLLFFGFGQNPALAELEDESFIGLLLDKNTCRNAPENFIDLPLSKNGPLLFNFYTSRIDESFGKTCKIDAIALAGFIGPKSFSTLQLAYQLAEHRRIEGEDEIRLYLDSSGGLIIEAMKIGDFIATKNTHSYVAFRGKCFSSCIFVLAAASIRSGIGDVGIHRPFASEISTENLAYSEYLKKYDGLSIVMKQYLSKFGVSPDLVDQMNVIPSDEIRILDDDDRDKVGLGFKNVAAKEFEKARTIQICGQDYYDLHIKFHNTIKICREKLGHTVSEHIDAGSPCWDVARTAFPNYGKEFDKCKSLKANQ